MSNVPSKLGIMKPALISKLVKYPCGCMCEYVLEGSIPEQKHKWRVFNRCNQHAQLGPDGYDILERHAEWCWEQAIENQ